MISNYLSFLLLGLFLLSNSYSLKAKLNLIVLKKDTLNVLAPKGVWLRNEINLQSEKLVKLPYATELILLENGSISEEIVINETKYFEIKGKVQKVKVVSSDANINSLEGYIFDGYLTKFPVPDLYYDATEEHNYLSADLNYLQTKFESYEKYNIKEYEFFDCSRDCACSFEQKFGNQKEIHYQTWSCKEAGGTDWNISIPNLSLREAYFFAIVLYYYDSNKDKDSIQHTLMFDEKKNTLRLYPVDSGAGCYIDIKQDENDILLISGYCGC